MKKKRARTPLVSTSRSMKAPANPALFHDVRKRVQVWHLLVNLQELLRFRVTYGFPVCRTMIFVSLCRLVIININAWHCDDKTIVPRKMQHRQWAHETTQPCVVRWSPSKNVISIVGKGDEEQPTWSYAWAWSESSLNQPMIWIYVWLREKVRMEERKQILANGSLLRCFISWIV